MRIGRTNWPGCTKGKLLFQSSIHLELKARAQGPRNPWRPPSLFWLILLHRFKAEMWAKVAEEMAIPWRAAEAMHWQLGEQEMARRAGVVPFSLSSTDEPPSKMLRSNTGVGVPRIRRASGTRAVPHQLPSVEELTAGVPAYAPSLTQPEPYHTRRPTTRLSTSQPGELPAPDTGPINTRGALKRKRHDA